MPFWPIRRAQQGSPPSCAELSDSVLSGRDIALDVMPFQDPLRAPRRPAIEGPVLKGLSHHLRLVVSDKGIGFAGDMHHDRADRTELRSCRRPRIASMTLRDLIEMERDGG